MVVGIPASPHAVNTEGLKRRGFTAEQIRNLRMPTASCIARDLPLAEAIGELAALAPTQPELELFVEFIAALAPQPDPVTRIDARACGPRSRSSRGRPPAITWARR